MTTHLDLPSWVSYPLGMDHTSFRHLDYVSQLDENRLRLSKPNGYPIYGYDYLEYVGMSSCEETIVQVCTHADSSFISAHFKRNHLHNREHHFAGLCVVVVMTCLYLLNNKRYIPFSSKDNMGVAHFWFVDVEKNVKYDPTGSQYTMQELQTIYKSGKPTIYYGWGQRPATRFLNLIQKIQPNSVRYKKEGRTRPLLGMNS